MGFVDRRVNVDGAAVAYVDAGPADGPPLLLLHGAGFDHAELTWRLTVAALSDRHRVVVPDLPGYGDSADLGRAPDLVAMAGWVPRFMDAIGVARADIAGVSMGGGMALWLAIHHPSRVRRLVPVCAYGLMPRAPHHALAHAAFRLGALAAAYRAATASPALARLGLRLNYRDPGRVTPRAVAELRAVAAEQGRRRSFDAFLAAEMDGEGLKTDLRADLGRIAAPTLLVAGAADRVVPPRHLRRACARIPDCAYLCLPTGHWPMRERPDLFNAALRRFLGQDTVPNARAAAS